MTKTEIKLILRPTHYLSKKDRQNIVDYIEEKEQRIEKAIKIINNSNYYKNCGMNEEEVAKISLILKGEE